MDARQLKERVRNTGLRFTKIRESLLELLLESGAPLSAPALLGLLHAKGITVNKTTIYRELDALGQRQIIRQVQLGGRAAQYEIIASDHHHHLVCLECKKVEDVDMLKDLDQEEKKITASTQFTVTSHSLEFYGICKGCKTTI